MLNYLLTVAKDETVLFGLNTIAELFARLPVNKCKPLLTHLEHANVEYMLYFANISTKKVEEKLKLLTQARPYMNYFIPLYLNRNIARGNIDSIKWFATNALQDEVILSARHIVPNDIAKMRNCYRVIPNAYDRATATMEILQRYVSVNSNLLDFITCTKVLTNTLTLSEIDLLHRFTDFDDIIPILLDNKQYDLILAYDNCVRSPITIADYEFTYIEAILCVCKCKNIVIEIPIWVHMVTLPLLARLAEYRMAPMTRRLFADIVFYIPDYADLI